MSINDKIEDGTVEIQTFRSCLEILLKLNEDLFRQYIIRILTAYLNCIRSEVKDNFSGLSFGMAGLIVFLNFVDKGKLYDILNSIENLFKTNFFSGEDDDIDGGEFSKNIKHCYLFLYICRGTFNLYFLRNSYIYSLCYK